MREHLATTPFGRRSVTLGQIAARLQTDQAIADAAAPGSNQPAAVHKWKLFRSITEAKNTLGVSDRSLSVLNALLSFHPETALSLPAGRRGGPSNKAGDAGGGEAAWSDNAGPGGEAEVGESEEGGETALVVFPSNRELSLRAHGVGERSLARHLASLVAAGLILRRDSPNGKRYARRARGGEGFSEAFGFDLTPLVARAAEVEAIAERLRQERRRMQVLRETISLHRRDIAKMIACGLEEGVAGDWDGFAQALLGFSGPLRRVHDAASLARLEGELGALRGEVLRALETHVRLGRGSDFEVHKESGNDGQADGHQSNSKSQSPNLEPASKEDRGEFAGNLVEPRSPSDATPDPTPQRPSPRSGTPLGMVLDACPDVLDWAPDGVRGWPDFLAAVRVLRPALGISPSAWAEAIEAMGEIDASIAVAAILQRHESSSDAVTTPSPDGGPPQTTVQGSPAIASAGGYLRALTEKAGAGEFSIAPILIANIAQRTKKTRTTKHDGRGRSYPDGGPSRGQRRTAP